VSWREGRTGIGRTGPAAIVILARVRRDGSPSDLRAGLAAGRRELALYLAAGVLYVAIGVSFPEFMFSWVVAAAFLVVCVVVVPAVVRRLGSRERA
jgi:hypothetical protein